MYLFPVKTETNAKIKIRKLPIYYDIFADVGNFDGKVLVLDYLNYLVRFSYLNTCNNHQSRRDQSQYPLYIRLRQHCQYEPSKPLHYVDCFPGNRYTLYIVELFCNVTRIVMKCTVT